MVRCTQSLLTTSASKSLREQAIGRHIMGAGSSKEYYGGNCTSLESTEFENLTAGLPLKMLRVNVLTLINAILAVILVGIGTYGTRYQHRAISGSLFHGATILFLPIVSYVSSNASSVVSSIRDASLVSSVVNHEIGCNSSVHLVLSLIWAGLVQIVGINTCPTVAASDREGRNVGIPLGLLVQAIWVSYLFISLTPEASFDYPILPLQYALPATMFGLIFAKMALRYYEFGKARRSFALGRNPPLIVGYAAQMQEESEDGIPTRIVEHCRPCPPPPLIVMGEESADVEKGPHGFLFKNLRPNDTNNPGLVTIDRVWQLDDGTGTPVPWLRLKDVCLSLALFKLLRCRFAGYSVAEAGFQQVYRFFLDVLLEEKDHERIHRVVTDELSFLHDYYYSATAMHYSSFWLPILNIFASLLIIFYCLVLAGVGTIHFIWDWQENGNADFGQLYCTLICSGYAGSRDRSFGNIVFDAAPVGILLVLVILSEAREIASHIFSNWTKVALICRYYVGQQFPQMPKWIGPVLRCQCKLMKHWDDKMNQCSVLVLKETRAGRGQMLSVAIRHLFRLPTDRKKNVKVPGEVKAAIVNVLIRDDNGRLTDPRTFLRESLQQLVQDGSNSNSFLWACDSKGISDLILMWHIATSILSVREQQPRPSQDMVTAEHLSRYCTYLVAYVPELLPDDDAWCKSLYKAIKEEAIKCALAGHGGWSQDQSEYDKLVTPLQERAKHAVLKKGVELGKQLVELQEEDVAWRLLAGFWSRMILYIGPSDNLNGHADAIARGGELITLVWALLMHVGIACRHGTPDAPATSLGV